MGRTIYGSPEVVKVALAGEPEEGDPVLGRRVGTKHQGHWGERRLARTPLR